MTVGPRTQTSPLWPRSSLASIFSNNDDRVFWGDSTRAELSCDLAEVDLRRFVLSQLVTIMFEHGHPEHALQTHTNILRQGCTSLIRRTASYKSSLRRSMRFRFVEHKM